MVSPTIPQKRCSAKGLCLHPEAVDGWLPATNQYFHRKRESPDGLNNKCKRCNQVASREWAVSHPERAKAYQSSYRTTHQADLRLWRQAYHARHRHRHLTEFAEYQLHNASRLQERQRKHYAANAVRIGIANRQRRARRKNAPGTYTVQDVRLLLRSQKGACWWCGQAVGDKYHVDHRVPLSRGGTNFPENLCVTCPTCNLSKHDKLPSEWNGRLL